MKLPLVLIIGRANVGKSGLFNSIVGRRQALISKIPGTTRDINFAEIRLKNVRFTLGDSAGLENLKEITRHETRATSHENIRLDHLIELKTLEHLERASVLILVVDAENGLMPQDREIMKFLRSRELPFVLAVNKVDGKNDESKAEEFLRLHINPTFPVSSITRKGIGDLLDYIAEELSRVSPVGAQDFVPLPKRKTIRVALIGRTNVGKSTLTNALSETHEMIVSSVPHTTREPHAMTIPLNDAYDIELIDTAGVRKKAKIDHFLEIAGVRMSLEKLKRTDVILFVIDLTENLASQDLALARLIAEHRRSCIIVGNKFDVVKKAISYENRKTAQQQTAGRKNIKTTNYQLPTTNFESYIRKALPKLNYAPILFVSAKEGSNIPSLKPLILNVYENTYHMFPEHDVNVILQNSLKLQPPPIVGEKKRKVQVTGLFQNSKNPKEFILKVYTKDYVPPNFVKFIEKQLKTHLPLQGVPIYITVENTREG